MSYTVEVGYRVEPLHAAALWLCAPEFRDMLILWCAGAMQCKISQSGRMELQDVAGLPFDVVAARIKPFTWEEFFARISHSDSGKKKQSFLMTLSKKLRDIFLMAWGS